MARALVRRAERLAVDLSAREPVNEIAVKYLNRLSDFLFVAARWANDPRRPGGEGDVLWVPGKNRGN
jgi:cob(I)alamin adenosyltransferase